ncbi:MAG: hypothetical protein ACLUWN_01605 [Clostridia bacterium]|jgi:hypothetical protein
MEDNKNKRLDNTILAIKDVLEKNNKTDTNEYKDLLKLIQMRKK